MRRGVARAAGALVLALGAAAPASAGTLPEWVASDRAVPTPRFEERVDAYVLRHEAEVRVPRSGRAVHTERRSVRILTSAAREHAAVSVTYLRRSSAVRSLRIWTVRPDGATRSFDKGDVFDVSLAGSYTLYSDERALEFEDEGAGPGSFIAWEWTIESEPFLAEWSWRFQDELPVRRSSFTLELPPGASIDPRVGGGAIEARRQGERWIWEARDLPPRKLEPLASSSWHARPWLAVRHAGVSGVAGRSFASWSDLARWIHELADPAGLAGGDLVATSARLTHGVTDPLERVRAVVRHVQNLAYVAVDLDISRGDGYRPHPAGEVLRLGYGDCKDKANLARVLLRAAGHEAWLLVANAGDRHGVDTSWASPGQFDHCIAAVRVPEGTKLPAVFQAPGIGTLLAFDPTDPWTVLGDLPRDEQGSWGLLVDALHGGIVRLPGPTAEHDRIVRRVEAVLGAGGGLKVRLEESHAGQRGRDERSLRASTTDRDYRGALERRLSSAGAVSLATCGSQDDPGSGQFHIRAEYEQPNFGRLIPGQLLMFRAPLEDALPVPVLADTARREPIVLPAGSLEETVTFTLPEGMVVDELPPAVDAEREFGGCVSRWTEVEGGLRFERAWRLTAATIPPERYREVREFIATIRGTGSATVVLRKR